MTDDTNTLRQRCERLEKALHTIIRLANSRKFESDVHSLQAISHAAAAAALATPPAGCAAPPQTIGDSEPELAPGGVSDSESVRGFGPLDRASEGTASATPPAAAQPAPSRYDIMRDFREGMADAINRSRGPVKQDGNTHWYAGWRAGKEAGHDFGNRYLISIGREPMGIVVLADAAQPAALSGYNFNLLNQWAMNPKQPALAFTPGLLREVATAVYPALVKKPAVGEAVQPAATAGPRVPAVAALIELVRLKDGPRDEAYRSAKDKAWQYARDVLATPAIQPTVAATAGDAGLREALQRIADSKDTFPFSSNPMKWPSEIARAVLAATPETGGRRITRDFVVLYDGGVAVIVRAPELTLGTQVLDWYSKVYAMERTKLSIAAWVETVDMTCADRDNAGKPLAPAPATPKEGT